MANSELLVTVTSDEVPSGDNIVIPLPPNAAPSGATILSALTCVVSAVSAVTCLPIATAPAWAADVCCPKATAPSPDAAEVLPNAIAYVLVASAYCPNAAAEVWVAWASSPYAIDSPPDAKAFLPIAIELSPLAVESWPTATAPCALASAWYPTAVLNDAVASVLLPKATDCSPAELALCPKATLDVPPASAARPTAVDDSALDKESRPIAKVPALPAAVAFNPIAISSPDAEHVAPLPIARPWAPGAAASLPMAILSELLAIALSPNAIELFPDAFAAVVVKLAADCIESVPVPLSKPAEADGKPFTVAPVKSTVPLENLVSVLLISILVALPAPSVIAFAVAVMLPLSSVFNSAPNDWSICAFCNVAILLYI